MKLPLQMLMLTGLLAASLGAQAQGTAKDIVLDRVNTPLQVTSSAVSVRSDAMIVSILLESPDGSMTPRSTEMAFNSGDRFRVKVLASRAGRVSLYNTKPNGLLTPEPVWQGEVKPGQETISPRLLLDGASGGGVDQLHVVLEPLGEPGVLVWLGRWLTPSKSTAKDIRLDQQSTPNATYLVADAGKGLVTSVRIVHR